MPRPPPLPLSVTVLTQNLFVIRPKAGDERNLEVKVPNVFKEYFNKEKQTKESFTNDKTTKFIEFFPQERFIFCTLKMAFSQKK